MNEPNRTWMTEEEVNAFVGKNADYYKEKWKAHPETAHYKGWNGVALFFFFEWAAYRKMYREAILVYVGYLASVFLVSFIPFFNDLLAELLPQAIKILLFVFANGLYRKKALRTVRETMYMEDAEKYKYLTEKGGISILSLIICLFFETILVLRL